MASPETIACHTFSPASFNSCFLSQVLNASMVLVLRSSPGLVHIHELEASRLFLESSIIKRQSHGQVWQARIRVGPGDRNRIAAQAILLQLSSAQFVPEPSIQRALKRIEQHGRTFRLFLLRPSCNS